MFVAGEMKQCVSHSWKRPVRLKSIPFSVSPSVYLSVCVEGFSHIALSAVLEELNEIFHFSYEQLYNESNTVYLIRPFLLNVNLLPIK